MSIANDSSTTGTRPDDPVELRVSADLGWLPVVRAVAETLGLLADFNLDDVADLKLAVDEVCSELIGGARAGSELTLLFVVEDSVFRTVVSACVIEGYTLRRDGFGWRVLEAVVDGVEVTEATSGATDGLVSGRRVLTVELRKSRTAL